MLIVLNLFLPNESFYQTNYQTAKDLITQIEKYTPRPEAKTHQIIITGYVGHIFLEKVKDWFVDTDTDVNLEITSDYDQIISKCHLINRYLRKMINSTSTNLINPTYTWNSSQLFYLEYDITVPNLFSTINLLQEISQKSESAFLALNHDRHQMTIHEKVERVTINKTKYHVVQTFDPSVTAIGTGCFYLNLAQGTKFLKNENNTSVVGQSGMTVDLEIRCPSYGYGHDDGHLHNWLLQHNIEMKVVLELKVDHRALLIPKFDQWKQNIIERETILTKEEYQHFWETF